MRIQETDRILKESRISRNASNMHHTEQSHSGRSWMTMVTSLPQRLMSMLHKH